MRNKKKRFSRGQCEQNTEQERPMSWEGELSDSEMVIDTSNNNDAPELREAEKVRASQEKTLAALQAYTAAHSPETSAKFGELLMRIPELQRTCQYFMQVGKEMLNPANKSEDGEVPKFNLLMELLRGDH